MQAENQNNYCIMRKFTLLTLFLAACLGSNAKDITQTQAMNIARGFLNRQGSTPGGAKKAPANLRLAYTGKALDGRQCLFVFNNGENQGFVVVAADDQADTILGYSDNAHSTPRSCPTTCAHGWRDTPTR